MPTEPLPPRQAWEEPPPGGWTSGFVAAAIELGLLVGSLTAAVVATRAVGAARRLGAHGWLAASLWWLAAGLLVALLALYLWRRADKLVLIAAMLTDYGRLARLGGRPPIWLDQPPEDALRVVHLSDLHVAESPSVRLIERARPAGNGMVAALFDRTAALDADIVLITGDATDRGTAAAWRPFLAALGGLGERTILVPGNHDIALLEPLLLTRHARLARADRFGVVQLANLAKFADAFARTYGGRVGAVMQGGRPRPFLDAHAEIERDVRPLLLRLPEERVPPLSWRRYFAEREAHDAYRARIDGARARLLALFPVAVPLEGRDAVVFVLNSCARVFRYAAANAIGRVGHEQYRRLFALAEFFPQPLKLVALHHHVVRRGEELSVDLKLRLQAKFTVLTDASPLVRFCKEKNVRAVLNGHRHISYQLRLPNGTVLIAAPSSTFGDELAQDPRPQLWCYEVAREARPPSVGIYRTPFRLDLEEAKKNGAALASCPVGLTRI